MLSRRALLGSLAGATGLALAGCGGTEGSGSGAGETGAAFPVRVPNTFGETVVEAAPSAVYSLGFTDQDPLLALGVLPVAITQWMPQFALGPWATEARAALDGPDPEVLSGEDGTNLEAVAAAAPELITSYYSALEREEYDRLTKLAPVVTRPAGAKPWSSDWASQVTAIGTALGRAHRANQLIDQVKQKFADARSAHPQFDGATMSVVRPGEGGVMWAYTGLDPRYRVMEQLGFVLPESVASLPDAQDAFYVTISAEQVSLLDADVIGVIATTEQESQLAENAVWQRVPAVAAGRSVTLDVQDAGAALSFGTVLSVPYALDLIVPMLEPLLRG